MNRLKKVLKRGSLQLHLCAGFSTIKTRGDQNLMRNALCAALLVCMMVFGLTEAAFSEGKRVSAFGTLTSIESDGTVIIDESGYEVDSNAGVLTGRKEQTTLDRFTLPAKVMFEYEYTPKGAIIKLIKEIPQ